MDLDARPYRYFVTLAERLSFRRAAEAHNISQPALSAQIKELERRLGFALFVRTRRTVELTPQGSLFLDNARRIILETDLVTRAANEIRRDRLRVGTAHHTAAIPERNALVSALLASRPGHMLRIHNRAPAQLYDDLAAGLIEMAVVLEVAGPHALRSAVERDVGDEFLRIALGRRPVTLAVPLGHPLHGARCVALPDLRGCKIGALSRAHGIRVSEVIARALRQAGAELVALPEGDAVALLRYAPILGIAVVSLGWFGQPAVDDRERLAELTVEDLAIETELVILRSRRPGRPAVDRLWEVADALARATCVATVVAPPRPPVEGLC